MKELVPRWFFPFIRFFLPLILSLPLCFPSTFFFYSFIFVELRKDKPHNLLCPRSQGLPTQLSLQPSFSRVVGKRDKFSLVQTFASTPSAISSDWSLFENPFHGGRIRAWTVAKGERKFELLNILSQAIKTAWKRDEEKRKCTL